MKNKNTRMTTKKAAALLAAIAIAPTVMGLLPTSTQSTPLGISSAQAQPRWGTPDWERNRESRRANHYRDSDLARLSWATIEGTVNSNPANDYFEFRAINGQQYRVLARSNVSLRGINRNDRVRVYGKRDGNILIAYSVTKLSGSNNSGVINLRARVVSNIAGNRFTIRHNNANRIVVAKRGEPNGLRAGSEVDMTGTWRNNIFHATSVRLRDNDWGGGWQDGQTRRIRGRAMSDLNNSRFSLRMDNNMNVIITTSGSSIRRISRGDYVEVVGRWDRNNNVFRGDSATVLRDNDNDDDFRNGSRVDFEGVVTKATRMGSLWYFTVRTDSGRNVTVRHNRQFWVGNRVEVEGIVQNNTVIASRMNND